MKRAQNKKANVGGIDKFVLKNSLYLLIASFLVIVIIKIILSLKFYSPFILNDELYYDSMAKNVLNGQLVPILGGARSPGYPIILSIAYLLSGDKGTVYHIMLAISAFVTTSIIFPSYFILKKYCAEKISLLGSVAITVLPFMNLYSFTIMSEALFIPLFMFSIWFLINSYGTDDKKWQLLASVSAVYLYMTRPNGLAIAIAFVAAFVYYVIVATKTTSLYEVIWKKINLALTFIILLDSWILYSALFSGSVFSLGSFIFIIVVIALIMLSYYIVTRVHVPLKIKVTMKNIIALSAIVIAAFLGVAYMYSRDLVSLFFNNNSYYSFGSSFNVLGTSQHVLDIFNSWDNFTLFAEIVANDISYMFICSFFVLTFVIFYYLALRHDKKARNDVPLSSAAVYIIVSFIFLLLSVIALRFYGGEGFVILGRYIDPILPSIFLFGIILLNELNELRFRKYTGIFSIIFALVILIVIFVLEFNYSILTGFMQFQSNEALYYLEWVYHNSFPEIYIMIFSLVVMALLFLSIMNKKHATLFLIFLILSSILLSINMYNSLVDNSSFRKDNPISLYMVGHTDRNTLVIVDTHNMDFLNQTAELALYGYWNNGDCVYGDAQNLQALNISKNRTTFIITTESLPYEQIVTDTPFKLYSIQ